MHAIALDHCWQETLGNINGWQGLLGDAALQVANLTTELAADREEVYKLVEGLEGKLQLDVEAAVNAYQSDSFDLAARIGYALAKTWPAGVDGLPDWPFHAAHFLQLLPGAK